jgi:hypothetical protein
VQEERQRTGTDAERLAELAAKAPDLATLVAEERMTLAEAEGRVLTGRGGDRSKGKNSLCIDDPRAHFAKQFGSTKSTSA